MTNTPGDFERALKPKTGELYYYITADLNYKFQTHFAWSKPQCLADVMNGNFFRNDYDAIKALRRVQQYLAEHNTFKPHTGQYYYYINFNNGISKAFHVEYDDQLAKVGNCFPTPEYAELMLLNVRSLLWKIGCIPHRSELSSKKDCATLQ